MLQRLTHLGTAQMVGPYTLVGVLAVEEHLSASADEGDAQLLADGDKGGLVLLPQCDDPGDGLFG